MESGSGRGMLHTEDVGEDHVCIVYKLTLLARRSKVELTLPLQIV